MPRTFGLPQSRYCILQRYVEPGHWLPPASGVGQYHIPLDNRFNVAGGDWSQIMTAHMDIILESESTTADRAAVADVFTSAGLAANIRGAYIRESAGLDPWIIVISATTGTFLVSAAKAFGEEVGKDAWKGLKLLITALYQSRKNSRAPEGEVQFSDPNTRINVHLPAGLPDQAYRRLYEIEHLRAALSGNLVWKDDAQDWVDELQGCLICDYPGCASPADQSRVRQTKETTWERRGFCQEHAASADGGDPNAWK